MDKSVVKKCIKRVAIASVAAVIGMNLFACTKPETDKITIEFDKDLKTNEQKSKEQESKTQGVTITPEEAARGKTVENTKRTVNEYGITIYGKPISENEVISKGLNSEIGIKNDKKRGRVVKYTEYYSEVQGSIIYLATVVDTGSKEYFNKDGIRIGTGGSESANVDIEKILANVKMGNAMAEAIDRSVKNNK